MPFDPSAELEAFKANPAKWIEDVVHKMRKFIEYVQERSKGAPELYFMGVYEDLSVTYADNTEELYKPLRTPGSKRWVLCQDGKVIGKGTEDTVPKQADIRDGWVVMLNGEPVYLNGHVTLPTLEDAKGRVYLYSGMMMAQHHKNGDTATSTAIHRAVFGFLSEWPWEDTPMGYKITVGPLNYEIHKVN